MPKIYNETIKDESNNIKTYAIKIGQSIPDKSVNMAYVGVKNLNPKDNISITNYHGLEDIVYNEMIMYSDSNFKLTSKDGLDKINNDSLIMTDEFSIPSNVLEKPVPLYYAGELSSNIILSKTKLMKYVGGYTLSTINELKNMLDAPNLTNDDKFIYIDNNITLNTLSSNLKYKIVIEKSDTDKGKVIIYTNIEDTKTTVTYNSENGRKDEILNVYTIFSRDDSAETTLKSEGALSSQWENNLTDKIYALKQVGDQYEVYTPTELIIADKNARGSHNFKYRVESNRTLNYDLINKGVINVGFYSVNATSTSDISHAMVHLQNATSNGSSIKPSYIDFKNPHPYYYNYETATDPKLSADYWKINIDMPAEYFNDYDVIVIGGIGETTLSLYENAFENYLDNGGSLWIDNGGSGNSALVLDNTTSNFLIGVEFDSVNSEQSYKITNENYMNTLLRYYDLDNDGAQTNIGSPNINPKIILEPTENASDWHSIISYNSTNGMSIIAKRVNTRGIVVVSNCGIFPGIMHPVSGSLNDKIAVNILTILGEDTWVTTPWISDYVSNIDNLFKEEIQDKDGYYKIFKDPNNGNMNIAKKRLKGRAKDLIDQYFHTNIFVSSETYKLHVEQLFTDSNGFQHYAENELPSSIVLHDTISNGNDSLYVYTNKKSTSYFNPLETGYYDSQVRLYDESLEYCYTVCSCTYEWDENINGYKKNYGNAFTYGFVDGSPTLTIKKSDGAVTLGGLAKLAPALLEGWSDRSKVYFEVFIGSFEPDSSSVITYLDTPISINIQNSINGTYYTNSNGDSAIGYEDLYSFNDGLDIVITVNTNYETIMANKRVFALKETVKCPIQVSLPDTLDDRLDWYLKVSNGSENVDTTIGKLIYKVNEYKNQMFMPHAPYKQVVDGNVIYLDYHKVQLEKSRVYYHVGSIVHNVLTKIDDHKYKSDITNWTTDPAAEVYISSALDPNTDPGSIQTGNYTIDYLKGIVTFNDDVVIDDNLQHVNASFSYNNFKMYKLKYSNTAVLKEKATIAELLTDTVRFDLMNDNIYKVSLYYRSDNDYTKLSFSSYVIDSENGQLIVNRGDIVDPYNEVSIRDIYVDYSYLEKEELTVSGIDALNSIVYTVEEIQITDKIRADYYYECNDYEYCGYMDNNSFVRLDLNPMIGHKSSVFTGTVNGVNVYEEMDNVSLINKPIYVYARPAYKKIPYLAKVTAGLVSADAYGNITVANGLPDSILPDKSLIYDLRTPSNLVSGSSVSSLYYVGEFEDNTVLVSINNNSTSLNLMNGSSILPLKIIDKDNHGYDFIKGYICNEYNIRHTFSHDEMEVEIANGAILLAEISIKEHQKPDDIVLMDSRTRGGGIKDTVDIDEVTKINNNVMNFWDIGDWDGIPYQSNGVTIIRLPISIKQKFTDDEIHKIIERYIACGIEYIVEYKTN